MASLEPFISFEQVSLWVEGHQYLDRADLQVERGETLVVAGLPGCGKSFVLRLVLGLPGMGLGEAVHVDGRVAVEGHSITEMTPPELRQWRCRTGALLRGGALIENMDIRHNIGLPLDYHCRERLAPETIDARCRLMLADMGLSQLHDSGLRPVSLNREQRLYVALARALVAEPEVLLMDAPATGLSPASAERIVEFCLDYAPQFAGRCAGNGPVTRLLTTNDMSRYLARGSRFAMLCEGRLIDLGDSSEVATCSDDRVRELLTPDGDAGPLGPVGPVAVVSSERGA